jgi:hypothetical protein
MRHPRFDPAKAGVEEARIVIVRWFDTDGVSWNSVKSTGPDDGTVGPDLVTELGMLVLTILSEWQDARDREAPE